MPEDLVALAGDPVVFEADAQLTANGSTFDFDGHAVALRSPAPTTRATPPRR